MYVSGRGGNKCRMYKLFKHRFETEIYSKLYFSFSDRTAFAKLRCAVEALSIETGRFEISMVEERIYWI